MITREEYKVAFESAEAALKDEEYDWIRSSSLIREKMIRALWKK